MLLALSLTLGQPALAAGDPASVLIWMEKDLPDEKTVKKTNKLVGGNPATYTGQDLSFPPQPHAATDDEAYAELDRAITRSKERWNEFDVERSIAQELVAAIEPIELVRNDEDRKKLVEAWLIVGAAVDLAWTQSDFENVGDAGDFRLEMPGKVANLGLVQVVSMEPEAKFTRAEVANGSAFDVVESLREEYPTYAPGTLDLAYMPAGTTLVVNGRPQENPGHQLALGPGHYWVHLEKDGLVTGRSEVDIFPGLTVELPMLVEDRELSMADRRVAADSFDNLPEDVVTGIDLISARHPTSEVFLATQDSDGKTHVVPYSEGAELIKTKVVTVTFGGEVGGGGVGTAGFRLTNPQLGENTDTTMVLAPAATGAFDLEVGIYNLALLGGAEVHITPTQAQYYGTDGGESESDNGKTPVYLKAHGGLGAYVIRPNTKKQATLLVGGTYGWFSPGHLGPGGRVTIGIPTGVSNWFKLTLHGYYGQPMEGFPPDRPLIAAGLRIGFQSSI
ncbi:MAG: hypothetical protein GY913_28640 [Proteobacteria bacterium]|nr:hypothetical protein [Pseudomonadota bacterium]